MRTEILMFDGVDELDVVAPFEILVSTGFDVELVTMRRCPSVTGAHGMTLTPHAVLGSRPSLLIVPGGRWASKAPDSAWGEVDRGVLPAAIAERHAGGHPSRRRVHRGDADCGKWDAPRTTRRHPPLGPR